MFNDDESRFEKQASKASVERLFDFNNENLARLLFQFGFVLAPGEEKNLVAIKRKSQLNAR
jgi:hypothetical protein